MYAFRFVSVVAAIFILGNVTAALATDETPKPKHAKSTTASSRSLEARHSECLAFIQRHGLTCDPWQQPTCGYDLGMFRPLSCVAP